VCLCVRADEKASLFSLPRAGGPKTSRLLSGEQVFKHFCVLLCVGASVKCYNYAGTLVPVLFAPYRAERFLLRPFQRLRWNGNPDGERATL